MKKRFVAKQVGVLSLTAVLAGMPAVNVLAEDVYAQKVESLQKEMLEQAVATETKLNITFETVHGEKVGETVAKTTATGTGDWTFMLGTDYQLPCLLYTSDHCTFDCRIWGFRCGSAESRIAD